ncbi:hypothetical protein T552_02002 [Pneumocystis carinii B80]|uniref:TFIIS N-terminal domain-containing protein n=1 Tax=Pneumocystis carinii (strain B80) TaxID=1408658 RepID=A0A0W4ZID3_PNEC8|nr:hypothetical protein T552_02002 [Pneumocystis carinii B80]KTW28143.1 hypothetical protein T552_02002 [Pneumocystis carinii B80]
MNLSNSNVSTELGGTSGIGPYSDAVKNTDESSGNLKANYPENITLDNTLHLKNPLNTALSLEKPLENVFRSNNMLNNVLNSLSSNHVDTPVLLTSAFQAPTLQTNMEAQKSTSLNISSNHPVNAVYTYRKDQPIDFLTNDSKHIFEEMVQKKQEKELSDAMYNKRFDFNTSVLSNKISNHNLNMPLDDKTYDFCDYNTNFSKYYETNENEEIPQESKNIPFKFPGIPIPNLPFATIMDTQTDNPHLEKTTVQNKLNTIKKNETPIIKNQLAPKDPEDVLRYELRKCFSVYAVTGDTRSCVRTVYDLMKDIVEDKTKIVMLETLKGGIKEDIVAAFIENKQVLGRIRNWLVNAINEKKNMVIIAILKIMNILKLDSTILAELKMGKPIIILAKKSENETVKQLSIKWLEAAEKSLSLEKPTENSMAANIPPISTTEDISKKKQKAASNDPVIKPSVTPKPAPAKPVVKSQKVQAVANTDFFKNLSTSAAKASQKPSLSSVLAQIKAPKKQSSTQPQVIETISSVSKKFTSVLEEVPGCQPTPEIITTNTNTVPDDIPKKKRKCVSWKSDDTLVEIRIFEPIEPEDTDDTYIHISREFKNARDLDIYEGRAAFSKTHNIEDDMMTWREPEDIDFSHLESQLSKLGPKRGGISKCNSDEFKIQEERERFVFLVSYLYEKDIPHSPTEPDANSDGFFVETKIIPLPNDMKDSDSSDYLFQHNTGSTNNLSFSNINQNTISLPNTSSINNTQANITSILQNLLNASGQATINNPSSISSLPQTTQYLPLPSSTISPVNIANITNILQILQQAQKKPLQSSFPTPTLSSTASPFNFSALLGGQQKNLSYSDWNERNDTSRSRDKRQRTQRRRR